MSTTNQMSDECDKLSRIIYYYICSNYFTAFASNLSVENKKSCTWISDFGYSIVDRILLLINSLLLEINRLCTFKPKFHIKSLLNTLYLILLARMQHTHHSTYSYQNIVFISVVTFRVFPLFFFAISIANIHSRFG